MPAPTSTAALRVALYTRVSTDMQASKDEGSLDTQEARLRAAVMSRNGPAEITQVFREEGASGKNLTRACDAHPRSNACSTRSATARWTWSWSPA